MSEKRSGRGRVLAEHLFSALSSACVPASLFCLSVDVQVLFDVCRHSRLARKAQVSTGERVPTVISIASCHIASYGLVCFYRFPFLSVFWFLP